MGFAGEVQVVAALGDVMPALAAARVKIPVGPHVGGIVADAVSHTYLRVLPDALQCCAHALHTWKICCCGCSSG